ncbi:MAG: adenylate/guanylate cyclase domain-containing protein [Pseudomonadota bacterium]|nr:adenylate/guanylate cyclase domain-containing protein [Pseudomonadota bacterium]
MKAEEFFDREKIIDISFFNFENAITAGYYANSELEIEKTNKNFAEFFPILGDVKGVYFPNVLRQLGIPEDQVTKFETDLLEKGKVLIPQIKIELEGEERVFSLLSARTRNDSFSFLNGVQGQFVDRTSEWLLRKEREELLVQKERDSNLIKEKSVQLENLATRLAKYLSPQIYTSIFEEKDSLDSSHKRKNLTIFFSDIVKFTDITDSMEPERLASVVNSYLSEMSSIALEFGGTIDKFIGDAILVFFGDPDSKGDVEDALRCVEMAIRMQGRVQELEKSWRKQGLPDGLSVRMGISTGFCTVGNFGSDLRLDYTVLGSPVNLAARLQGMAEPGQILVDSNTQNLVSTELRLIQGKTVTPKGFSRAIETYRVVGFKDENNQTRSRKLSRSGKRVEINVIDSSDIRAALEELKQIQDDFEKEFAEEIKFPKKSGRII